MSKSHHREERKQKASSCDRPWLVLRQLSNKSLRGIQRDEMNLLWRNSQIPERKIDNKKKRKF